MKVFFCTQWIVRTLCPCSFRLFQSFSGREHPILCSRNSFLWASQWFHNFHRNLEQAWERSTSSHNGYRSSSRPLQSFHSATLVSAFSRITCTSAEAVPNLQTLEVDSGNGIYPVKLRENRLIQNELFVMNAGEIFVSRSHEQTKDLVSAIFVPASPAAETSHLTSLQQWISDVWFSDSKFGQCSSRSRSSSSDWRSNVIGGGRTRTFTKATKHTQSAALWRDRILFHRGCSHSSQWFRTKIFWNFKKRDFFDEIFFVLWKGFRSLYSNLMFVWNSCDQSPRWQFCSTNNDLGIDNLTSCLSVQTAALFPKTLSRREQKGLLKFLNSKRSKHGIWNFLPSQRGIHQQRITKHHSRHLGRS